MQAHVVRSIENASGWLPFDRFMHEALYAPGLGYYAASLPKLGLSSADGSDFVTAPELSPHFGRALAAQVAQILQATQTDTVYEFGAGRGKLAGQIIAALQTEHPGLLARYVIVDISSHLRSVQQEALADFGDLVQWADALPEALAGVLLGNEVLDAMPVKLLQRKDGVWHERGVTLRLPADLVDDANHSSRHSRESGNPCNSIKNNSFSGRFGGLKQENYSKNGVMKNLDSRFRGNDEGRKDAARKNEGARQHPCASPFLWQDRPTDLRPPVEIAGEHDYLTEIHPQAEGFIATLAERLQRGAMLWIDYGFSEAEYYHHQRYMGTLMCHRGHRSDPDPLAAVGLKDITAHINFTGIALTAQNAGADVLGYTTQGRFLINCGLLAQLENSSLPERAHAQKLIFEHEMGELFKVIAIGKNCSENCELDLLGFTSGDRSHTL